jgi:hypothetical protein
VFLSSPSLGSQSLIRIVASDWCRLPQS